MKVILVSDIPQVGQVGDIKEVSQGYARNFLLPKQLAVPATPENIQRWTGKKQRQMPSARQTDRWQKFLPQLDGKRVRLQLNANEEGKLFGAIHQRDVARAVDQQLKVRLPEEFVVLPQPIKTIGEHTVVLQTGSISANIIIEIVPQS